MADILSRFDRAMKQVRLRQPDLFEKIFSQLQSVTDEAEMMSVIEDITPDLEQEYTGVGAAINHPLVDLRSYDTSGVIIPNAKGEAVSKGFKALGGVLKKGTELPVVGPIIEGAGEGVERLSSAAGGFIDVLQGDVPGQSLPPIIGADVGNASIQALSELFDTPILGQQPRGVDFGESIFENNPEAALMADVASPGILGLLKVGRGLRAASKAQHASRSPQAILKNAGLLDDEIDGIMKAQVEHVPVTPVPPQEKLVAQALQGDVVQGDLFDVPPPARPAPTVKPDLTPKNNFDQKTFNDTEFIQGAEDINDLPKRWLSTAASPLDPIAAVDIMDGKGNLVRTRIQRPLEDAEFGMQKDIHRWGEVTARVMKRNKLTKKDRQAIFHKIDDEPALELTPEQVNGERFFNAAYKYLLTESNKSRVAYGLKPIKERPDYITHVWEESFIDMVFGNTFTPEADALRKSLGEVNGAKKAPWFAYALQRKGKGGFQDDALKAFSAYLPGAMRQIHMLEPVAQARSYTKYLPENAKEYVTKWLDEGALAKRTWLDTLAIKDAPRASEAFLRMSSAVARNYVLMNPSTVGMQLTSIPQVMAQSGPLNTLAGGVMAAIAPKDVFLRTIKDSAFMRQAPIPIQNMMKGLAFTQTDAGWRFALQNSKQVQMRNFMRFEDVAAPRFLKSTEDLMTLPMRMADNFTVAASFNAGYIKATRELGLVGPDAIRYADEMAARTQAVYDRLWKSPAMRNRMLTGSVLQFQNWVSRQFNEFGMRPRYDKSLTKLENLGRMGTFMGAQLGVNSFMHMMGLRVPFRTFKDIVPGGDIIADMGIPGFKEPGDDIRNFWKGKNFQNKAAISFPLKQVFGGAVDNLWQVGLDMADDTSSPEAREQHLRNLAKYITIGAVRGGNALQKAGFGIYDWNRGFIRSSNRNIELEGFPDKIRALLLGSSGTVAARNAREPVAPLTTVQGLLQRTQ